MTFPSIYAIVFSSSPLPLFSNSPSAFLSCVLHSSFLFPPLSLKISSFNPIAPFMLSEPKQIHTHSYLCSYTHKYRDINICTHLCKFKSTAYYRKCAMFVFLSLANVFLEYIMILFSLWLKKIIFFFIHPFVCDHLF